MPTYTTVDARVQAARTAEDEGAWDDALRTYRGELEEARAAGNSRREAALLRSIGRLHVERGMYEEAREAFEESLVRAQAAGEPVLAAAALNAMAAVAQLRGMLDVAESLYTRAGAIAADLGDLRLAAVVNQNLGTIANIRGDLRAALLRYQDALELFRRLPDERAAAAVLNNMGMLHVDVEEWAAAELSFAAAWELAQRTGDIATQAKVDANRAELYLKRQTYERAREFCDRSFRAFSRIASHRGLASVHKFYGVLHRETGKPQIALVQLALALRLARTCDDRLTEAEAESERARVLLQLRNYHQAIVALNRAYDLFCDLDARREMLDVRRRIERLEEPLVTAFELWHEDEPILQLERTFARGGRVAGIAVRLAAALGYREQAHTLRVAAYLHDVGTRAVPAEIILKAGPLTEAERAVVRRHAEVGARMAAEMHFSAEVQQLVRHHHERWDGTGYPDRLQGEDIPFLARVLALADVYDALTTERAFRPALPHAEALQMMKQEAGAAFDPALFEVFARIMAPGEPVSAAAGANGSRARTNQVHV